MEGAQKGAGIPQRSPEPGPTLPAICEMPKDPRELQKDPASLPSVDITLGLSCKQPRQPQPHSPRSQLTACPTRVAGRVLGRRVPECPATSGAIPVPGGPARPPPDKQIGEWHCLPPAEDTLLLAHSPGL